MNVAELLAEVEGWGGTVDLDQDKLVVDVPEAFPDAIVERLRIHKPEIVHHLTQRRYEPLYPHPDQREEELRELVRRVEEDGYVLLWCEVLEDYVVYHRNDVDLATIPPSFVPYSEDELYHLFGADEEQPSPDALRLIHAAKKKGALVRDSTRES